MSLEVIQRATKEIESARKMLNSGQEVQRTDLTAIRDSLSKLRQEITKQHANTGEVTEQEELRSRDLALQELSNEIDARIKQHEQNETANRPAQTPVDEAVRKVEAQAEQTVGRLPSPIQRWLRDFFSGMRMNWAADFIYSYAAKEQIRTAMKNKLNPPLNSLVTETPRDRGYTSELLTAWRRKLRADSKNEDQLPFEQYYNEKIEEFAKVENDRLATNPGYRPQLTIGNLVGFIPAPASRNNPNAPRDLTQKERVDLANERPLLQARHAKQISLSFDRAMGGGVIITAPIPNIPSDKTPEERRQMLDSYQKSTADSVIAALRNPANRTKAHLMMQETASALFEYDPWWWPAENDRIMDGFREDFREDPIRLYERLRTLDTNISGVCSQAKRSLTSIKNNLNESAVLSSVSHQRGLEAINATTREEQTKKTESDQKTKIAQEQSTKKTAAES